MTDAVVHTRHDGIACNVFLLHRTQRFSPELIEELQDGLGRLLADQESARVECGGDSQKLRNRRGTTEQRILHIERKRAAHLALLRSENGGTSMEAVRVSLEGEAPFLSLHVECHNAPGLLASITDALALHDCAIQAAVLGVDDDHIKNVFLIRPQSYSIAMAKTLIGAIRERICPSPTPPAPPTIAY
mgnify:CR=1 FL=1